MASLSLKHISKVYGGTVKAVNDFCMEIEDKEFIVFVGPSGCGKSTTLRMIAGLEDITAGELRIDGEVVNDREPKDRNITMVFQNYALYPHMTVYENMAFSLRTAHMKNEEVHQKVTEAAEILGITEYLQRKPKALSGGQRQRVALGRAIVRNPKVFLLDEPLSNLDAKLRSAMRTEISLLHQRLGTTFIYVTHDQVEAMTMGTRIVVMKAGDIRQIDTPINLYKYPDNLFVAGFIGTPQMNFFDAVIQKDGEQIRFLPDCGAEIRMKYLQADKIPLKYMDGKTPVVFGIRPDDIRIAQKDAEDPEEWAPLRAVVSVVEMLGGESLVYANLNLRDPSDPRGAIVIKADPDRMVKRGDVIDILISCRKFHVFDRESEKSIRRRIPEENILQCRLENGKLFVAGQAFTLPGVLQKASAAAAELTMPVTALRLGEGEGRATVQRIEEAEGKTLYVIKAADLTLFGIEKGSSRYRPGDSVSFGIDMKSIRVDACGILPLHLQNHLLGKFIKEKAADKKHYRFYMEIEGQRLSPTEKLCKKLFSCKGTKIFQTSLEYLFDADAVLAENAQHRNALSGTVTEILDYGEDIYAKVAVGGQSITVRYSGNVGDQVNLLIDISRVEVKDRSLDIIIA